MAGSTPSKKTISSRLTEQTRQALNIYCKSRNISQSDAIRRFLREGLQEHQEENITRLIRLKLNSEQKEKLGIPRRIPDFEDGETERISARIPADTYHHLQDYSEEQNTTQSDAVRHLIVSRLQMKGYLRTNNGSLIEMIEGWIRGSS